MLSVDSTLFTLDWDNHGELDHEDRQALFRLLTQGQTQDTACAPEPQTTHQRSLGMPGRQQLSGIC